MNWYINESILRGSKEGGGREILGGVSRILLGHFHKILIYSQLKPSRLAHLLGNLIKGGVWVPGHRIHGM